MAADLSMDLDIEILPTVRRRDGLALSSRNAYLDKEEKRTARLLYQSLKTAEELIIKGDRCTKDIIWQSRKILEPAVKVDYMEICNSKTLKPITELDSGKALIALAGVIGKTRLIDNILVDIPT